MTIPENGNLMPPLLLRCLSERNLIRPPTFRAENQNQSLIDSYQFIKGPEKQNRITRGGFTSVCKVRTNHTSPQGRNEILKYKESVRQPKESLLTKYKSETAFPSHRTINGTFLKGKEYNRQEKIKLQQKVKIAYAKMAELQTTLRCRLSEKQVLLQRSKSVKYSRK